MMGVGGYTYAVVQGKELQGLVTEVGGLRIQVFREPPYLYEGSMEYEEAYLIPFTASTNSILVVAKLGDNMIGCITGTPIVETSEETRAPFLKNRISMDAIFYLGEIVLLKEFRGHGIGVKMFELFERYVRGLNKYEQIAICEIVRQEKTDDYFSLDNFWSKRQFEKQPHLMTHFAWKEVGKAGQLSHPMVFWLKKL